MGYSVGWRQETATHLGAIDRRYHPTIRDEVTSQLSHQPLTPTRNRKPLDRPGPFGAEWELRLGPENRFRVFYLVDEANRVVEIVAVGVKDRARLFIGEEEIET